MQIYKWKDPHRKRYTDIRYTDPNYCKYYDLDLEDFEGLVRKLQKGKKLTESENDRYGIYILTISYIVQEGPKFKNKPIIEREEMTDYQTLELLTGLMKFDPNKGKLYSFAYRIGYTSACHYYTDKIDDYKKRKAIMEHCISELEDYLYESCTHKVNNKDKE